MQQTVDAVVETKDLTDVVVDLVTTLVSGSSYFFCSAVAIAGVLTVAVADATIAASGSSSYSSSVADSVLAEAEMVAVVDATICAANLH